MQFGAGPALTSPSVEILMKRSVLCGSLAITALLAGACQNGPTLSPVGADSPLFAKPGGGGKADTDARANLVWSDAPHGFTPGIEGDKRSRDGSTTGTLDEYQGSYCGVYAKLFAGGIGSEDLDADFDAAYASDMLSSCGAARSLTLHLGGSLGDVVFGPHFIVRWLTHLAVGESRLQYMGFGMQQPSCQRVMFDSQYSGASDARITRLDDAGPSARQWRVESQGTRAAQCLELKRNGTLYPVGDPIFLPFSFTVTEVPYPYPTYP